MIDKQKLLTWIEDKLFVNSGPYDDDTPEEVAWCKGKINLLRVLEIEIVAGSLDTEEVAHERSEASSTSAART